MCLALPARIVAIGDDDTATVDLGGVRKAISVALTPGVAVGDYVVVHVGHAVGTVDADEAARTLALFAELAAAQAAEDTIAAAGAAGATGATGATGAIGPAAGGGRA